MMLPILLMYLDVTVTRAVNAMFCYRYVFLGVQLQMGLTLFEFIALAEEWMLYFGGTGQKVSKHAPECLRGQMEFTDEDMISSSRPIDKKSDALIVGLETITLIKCRGSQDILKKIESGGLKAVCSDMFMRHFIRQIFNMSEHSLGGESWGMERDPVMLPCSRGQI